MKPIQFLYSLVLLFLIACSEKAQEQKGFAAGMIADTEDTANFLNKDSLVLATKPGRILLTGISDVRLTPVYKVNYDKSGRRPFTGSNSLVANYSDEGKIDGNNWNYNYLPGIEAVYGYNMVNIAHYNIKQNKKKHLFEKPVLVKTLYFPSYSKDTLNYKAVRRNHLMVSVYNEDTNNDGLINTRDLRRFYLFDINGEHKTPLVPEEYSVLTSQYDPGNDFMYVFAQWDENGDGVCNDGEPVHIFWIDLSAPDRKGRQY